MEDYFILMNRDINLGKVYYNSNFSKFRFELNEGVKPFYKFYYVFDKDYVVPSNIISNFINDRVFPENRLDADRLLSKMGLLYYDKKRILTITGGTAVGDCFWFDWGIGFTWDLVKEKYKPYQDNWDAEFGIPPIFNR